jgi:hypothetical protein
MSDLYIQAGRPTNWIRPGGWLDLDPITTGSQKFSGLYAVYETAKNVNTITVVTTGSNTISWGDGTTQAVVSSTLYTKVYTYATITSPVLVDVAGLNYKMVVVNITLTNATQLYIDRTTTATLAPTARILGWLDIALDCSTMTIFIPSQFNFALRLQRLLIYNVGATINGTAYFLRLSNLQVLKFPFNKLTVTNQTFTNGMGNVRDENNLPLNIDLTINAGTLFNMFSSSYLTEVGNINAPSSISLQSMFTTSPNLRKVGTINAPVATTITSIFNSCVNLTGVINITTSSLLTAMTSAFSGCFLLDGVNISNCSGVTTLVQMFNLSPNLKSIILTGLTRGVSVDDCLMEATAIDALFTSLGTASGSQTIFVRRNPGSATCNTSIATTKGFTVVVA